jgi:hypothetical protein
VKTKIYVLCEPDGRIRYIGKTIHSLSTRLSGHFREARQNFGRYKCNWIRSLLSKGYLPIIQLIGEVEGNGCREEIAWIKYFKDEGINLVNGTDGGDGMLNPSPETRAKMIKARSLRKPISDETRAKMVKAHKGLIIPPEQRRKMAEGQIGKIISEEQKLIISKANKGRVRSEEFRRNVSIFHKGKVLSDETRRRISLGHLGVGKGVPLSEEHKQNIRNYYDCKHIAESAT